jgi:D-alanyl-D-alanine carboxypeptidase (penicillin-binding protein 5/6)
LNLKTKLLKILPYWLVGLIIISALQSAAVLALPHTKAAALTPDAAPQVLGDSITSPNSIRGQDFSVPNTINQISNPDLSTISAKSFLVFDLNSGQNLMEKAPGQKLAIASLTKLLTGLVAYKNSDLNQNIKIGPGDILNVKPNLNFTVGDNIKALDVFSAMLVGSCNDAALTLGNYAAGVAGENFVALMNRQASELGMVNSNFSNPMGFDSLSNYSTADDIKLLIAATQQLAAFKDLGRRTSYSFFGSSGREYSTTATNTLIKQYPDLEAIKTGLTEQAGQAMATKLTVGTRQIIILVLDSRDREADTLKLRQMVLDDFNLN